MNPPILLASPFVQMLLDAPVSGAVMVFTILLSVRAERDPALKERLVFRPYLVVHHNEWIRIFSSGFIHGGWIHLIFNMITFYYFAFPLETHFLGSLGFFGMYMAGMAIAHLPRLIISKDDEFYSSLGASGALSAVVLSLIMFVPNITLIFGLKGLTFGVIYILASFVLSIASRQLGRGRIGHDAHLWGALAGIVLTVIMRPQTADNILQLFG
ncbi:MAG: rhomboid family intramembrane serine protease [Bacteroidota bacterium]